MANRDGTGPLGQGPVAGRERSIGRGAGRGVVGGRGKSVAGRRQGGSKECTCLKCGYKEPHTRGIPCSEKKCPKCGTPMRGVFCS